MRFKAVKLRASSDGKVEVSAHDYIEHAKILSQPDADRSGMIQSALEKFLSRNDITKDQVVVGVPGQHTLARFSKLPPVQPKRIPDIVRYEADQQIPFDMDEVIWDYQTFQTEGMPDIEVGIFAMKREHIREYLLHFEQVGVEPVMVQSGPLAVYNAAHFDGLLGKDKTILLDIGAETTDVVIATPDDLWTRTIPIGGNNFTEALIKSFKLSFSKAENLKRTAATSKYARQIFQAMRPVFADLVQELQRSIGFYSSTHRDTKVERVICVGNAVKLPGLQKYLQQNLGYPVDRPELFLKATSPPAQGSQLQEEISSFWAAYGLALQGLELTRVTSNLLPTEIAKQVIWRKKRPAFAAAAACLLLAGGIIWSRYSTDMNAIAAGSVGADSVRVDLKSASAVIENGPSSSLSDRAKAKTILVAGQELKKELGRLSSEGKAEQDEAEHLAELQKTKTKAPRLLQVVHESLPRPEGPLGAARSPEEIFSASSAVPRAERKQVFIESFNMSYLPDVNEPAWPDSLVEVPPRINEADTIVPGFKLEIVCTTPHQGGTKFIQSTFMESLRNHGRRPDMGFYIDRVFLIEGRKVESKGATPSAKTGSPPPRSTPSRFSSGAESSGAGGKTDLLDPVTGEPFDGDWRFTIWADVVLENFTPPEGEPAEEALDAESPRGDG